MEKLIETLPKNAIDELRIEIGEFKGHDFVSIRTYTEIDTGKEKVPTKKGVTVKPSQLPELIVALQEAEREAKRGGLLSD